MKKLLIVLMFGLVLVGCNKQEKFVSEPDVSGRGQDESDEVLVGEGLGMSDVAYHNSFDDCWMVVDGKVYDVSKYIEANPKAATVTLGCGEDATELFASPPNDTGDLEALWSVLPEYLVGDLVE